MSSRIEKNSLHHHGFTLIEILVAIFIFSVLITVLFGSFQVLSSSSDALGKGTVQFEMGQRCISRIASDLEAVYVDMPPAYKQPELRESSDPYRIEGTTEDVNGNSFSRIRFTSLCHFSFSGTQGGGVAEIVYYVHSLQNGECVLRRSDRLYPYGEFEEKNSDPIVCKNIRGFSITYFNDDGEESETWDSESSEDEYATPRSVRIELQVGDEDNSVVFSTRIYLPSYREKLASTT